MTTTRRPAAPPAVEVGELLSIDVEAEVRKLSRAQLESSTQLPVELVRRAFAAGATRADVVCARRTVTVRDDGPPLSAETLDALASLLDPSAPRSTRHHSLLLLEAAGDLALLALAGVEFGALRVRSGGRVLHARRGETPKTGAAAGHGTTVEIARAPVEAHAVREAIAAAGRFADARITIDGAALRSAGFGATLAHERFDVPLPGLLSLPASGDTARVFILLDGLVAAHVALPGLPCFEAALDARSIFPRAGPLPPASALREAVEPHLGAVAARALELMERVAHAIDRVPEQGQARVREWVLAAATRKLRAEGMRGAPVFRVLPSRGSPSRLSIDDLLRLAAASREPDARASRGVIALFPEQDPSKFLLPAGAVPVLDAAERGRLSALIGVSFRPPPPRLAAGGSFAAVRAALAAVRTRARDAARRLRHPFGGRPLPDASLSAAEREFLRTLREHVMTESCEEIDVCFVAGDGPARHSARPRPALLLPRANPVVQAALQALGRDRAWIYPVALALDAVPRPATRSLFLRSGY